MIDERAKEELDGLPLGMDLGSDENADAGADIDVDVNDMDTNDDVNIDDVESDAPDQTSGFNVNNARDQLNGMVSRWFEIARSIPAEKREGFLKLGDRMDEIVKVIESEFL